MLHYTVHAGDTLWSIAERCYEDGHQWPRLAEANPLAQAGVLYEGMRLEVPARTPRPMIEAHRAARPLRHAPVRLRFDGSPLIRELGGTAMHGFEGELTFHRHGTLHLREFSPTRLLAYRLQQIAWVTTVFAEQLGNLGLWGSCGSYIPRYPVRVDLAGVGCTVTGNLGMWNHGTNSSAGSISSQWSWLTNPDVLFGSATLVLSDDSVLDNAPAEASLPLGRVIRAACPHLISPAVVWMFARDPLFFPAPTPSVSGSAPEANGTMVESPPRQAKKPTRKKTHGAKSGKVKKRRSSEAAERDRRA